MGILDFSKSELDIIGMTEDNDDGMNVAMRKHILHMIEEFTKEGHSGFSANYAINILTKLMNFEPLTPLTGESSEWNDVSVYGDGSEHYQNKRYSRVFKDRTGAYDIGGKVFIETVIEPNGETYEYSFTSRDSRVYITFPYTPKTEYVHLGIVKS